MMRVLNAFPSNETYDGNDLKPDRKREVRKEIDYANAICTTDAPDASHPNPTAPFDYDPAACCGTDNVTGNQSKSGY